MPTAVVAPGLMTRIHDRMPVILQDTEAETLWLDLATDTLDGVKDLSQPQEWEDFDEYEAAPLEATAILRLSKDVRWRSGEI